MANKEKKQNKREKEKKRGKPTATKKNCTNQNKK
jgi:hypothetical protein